MSISANLVRIQNAVDAAHADKEMLRLAINAKGGTLPESAALADFAAHVNKLPAAGNTPGDTIDLSFITATAGDIRSGKIGADTNGNPVNGTLVVESAGGGTAIYKCASVDVANKKWTGYKAVLTDGEYSFEKTATPDLTFTTVIPAVGKYYTADALMSITSVWQGYLVHLSTAGEDGYDISKYAHGVFINDPDMVLAEDGAFSFGGGYMGIDPLGDEFVFGTGDFTIEAYITPQARGRRQCFCAYHNDRVFAVCYSYGGDGKLGVFWRGIWECRTWNCALTDGQEYHIAIMRSGNKLQLFVNNYLQTTSDGSKYWDLSGVSIGESGQSFYFGRWGGDPGDFNGRWQGYMRDMKIANAALYAEVPPTPNPDNPDNPDDTGLKTCPECGSSNIELEPGSVYRCQDCGTGSVNTGLDSAGIPKYDVVVTRCVLCQTPLAQSQIKECSICTNQVCENCGDTLGTGAWQCYGC